MAASKGVDVAEVIALYEAGRSLHQIAEKYGVRHTAIHYHLRRQGVPIRPTGVHGLRMGLRPSGKRSGALNFQRTPLEDSHQTSQTSSVKKVESMGDGTTALSCRQAPVAQPLGRGQA